MEHVKAVMAMAVLVVVLLAMAIEAQAQSCPQITDYVACQSAVTVVNGAPSVQCCQRVWHVLNLPNGADCLCNAMTSSIAEGVGVIREEAIKLPSKCKKLIGLEYKPGWYKCDGSIVP